MGAAWWVDLALPLVGPPAIGANPGKQEHLRRYYRRTAIAVCKYMVPCKIGGMARRKATWDAKRVRALREHMGLTQQEMAAEMNTRQQTISEWETGLYQPRGTSERLLSLVAERANFVYSVEGDDEGS